MSLIRTALLPGLMVLGFTLLAAPALAGPCGASAGEQNWVPSRYYPPGSIVQHQGNWYEARQLHEGKEPGDAFEWKRLEGKPACAEAPKAPPKGQAANPVPSERRGVEPDAGRAPNEAPSPADPTTALRCQELPSWGFGSGYSIGDQVTYKGVTYQAIRPSNGHMPGTNTPPRWKPVDPPCPQPLQEK